MPRSDDRLLSIMVERGTITATDRNSVLQTQRNRRLAEGKHPKNRVGALIRELGLAQRREVNEALAVQRERSRHKTPPSPDFHGFRITTSVRALAVVAAAIFVAVAASQGVAWGNAASVAGFALVVLSVIAEWIAERRVVPALWKGLWVTLLLPVPVGLAIAYAHLGSLSEAAVGQGPAGAHDTADRTLTLVRRVIAVVLLSHAFGYAWAVWKHSLHKFAQARAGAIQDVIVHIERILHVGNDPMAERQDKAIREVVNAARTILSLSAWDRARCKVRSFFGRPNVTAVMYLVPFNSTDAATGTAKPRSGRPSDVPPATYNAFRVVASSFPLLREDIRRIQDWISDNHHPAALNKRVFDERIADAKRRSKRRWREEFLAYSDRKEWTSVTGWVHSEHATVESADASSCLAFDTSLGDQLLEEFDDIDDRRWFQVHSFVACPVFDTAHGARGVLLAIKNMRAGFVPEDREMLEFGALLIRRALDAKLGERPQGGGAN